MLDAIDAAVDGLCACGCQRTLDPDGPSAWYYNEGCQRKTMAAGYDQTFDLHLCTLVILDDPHAGNCADPYNWADDGLGWEPNQQKPAFPAWLRRLIGART